VPPGGDLVRLIAPGDAPRRQQANRGTSRIESRPDVRADCEKQGAIPMVMTPEAFGRYLADDIVKWERIVKVSGVKPDQ
jgi:tripartite-type tricarboxylate transporter receptor subunit TctC